MINFIKVRKIVASFFQTIHLCVLQRLLEFHQTVLSLKCFDNFTWSQVFKLTSENRSKLIELKVKQTLSICILKISTNNIYNKPKQQKVHQSIFFLILVGQVKIIIVAAYQDFCTGYVQLNTSENNSALLILFSSVFQTGKKRFDITIKLQFYFRQVHAFKVV